MARNRADAEDFAQVCLLARALAHQLNDIAYPRAYLYAILRNLHVDGIRRRHQQVVDLPLGTVTSRLARACSFAHSWHEGDHRRAGHGTPGTRATASDCPPIRCSRDGSEIRTWLGWR
ncbi:MAG: RNA polymerase sigma factor [Dongiaceae bacterium]